MRMRASHVQIDGEQLMVALEALIRDWPETVTYHRLGRAHIGARGLLQHQHRVGDTSSPLAKNAHSRRSVASFTQQSADVR